MGSGGGPFSGDLKENQINQGLKIADISCITIQLLDREKKYIKGGRGMRVFFRSVEGKPKIFFYSIVQIQIKKLTIMANISYLKSCNFVCSSDGSKNGPI